MTRFFSFHRWLKTPEGQDYSETSGSILILHGSVDPVSGMDYVKNLVKKLNDFKYRTNHIYIWRGETFFYYKMFKRLFIKFRNEATRNTTKLSQRKL